MGGTSMTPKVVIVGRPNVGKSTLFNRLVGKRLAMVDREPGVTRDWRQGEARLFDLVFTVIDTAGLDEANDESLGARMRARTEQVLQSADLALLVVDARVGLTALDRHFAAWLRSGPTPIALVGNKCESSAGEAGLIEAFALGLGEAAPISAEHGLGLSDLYDVIKAGLGTPESDRGDSDQAESDRKGTEAAGGDGAGGILQLAIVGRPNVGKSTLINSLIGQERLLTGPEAGITRDAIAVEWSYKDRPIRLVDTAGLRRRAKTTGKLDKLSAMDTLRTIRFAQVAVLLVDPEAPMERQDLTIAGQVVEEGRALIIAINKWDICPDRAAALETLRARLARSLPQTRGVPVVTISALRNKNLDALLDAVLEAYGVWNRRVPTARLNRWLAEVVEAHPPPAPGGRRIKLRYMTQPKSRPPSFVIFCSRPEALAGSYRRYLENTLRESFDIPGVPIRITLRKGHNPYVAKE